MLIYDFISIVLLRDYFNSLKLYRKDELSRSQIGRSGVQVKKEIEKFTVVCPRSLNLVISVVVLQRTAEKCTKL